MNPKKKKKKFVSFLYVYKYGLYSHINDPD